MTLKFTFFMTLKPDSLVHFEIKTIHSEGIEIERRPFRPALGQFYDGGWSVSLL